ncbi:phasin family protein [Psychrobium sp. 1_MG-2023]|uniref:phasin family protein n=1 Tax=Psychrobium sp. 1_MG-2023 TaxID=3062624 RepID=UPI000C322CBE|nr:phasin family protein [Psychrobium sp. 1_MG-2023]MDP2559758.1 phasin family protein [Psychrobium sp. 1_MG-2023]PKF59134.1 hypothetical protein CW748_02795 [Alteromonadales bacterium alter-6D02]
MTTQNQDSTPAVFDPLLNISKATGALWVDILSSNTQFLSDSLNQACQQAEKVINAQDSQEVLQAQQTYVEQQRIELANFSENLNHTFHKAQANYQQYLELKSQALQNAFADFQPLATFEGYGPLSSLVTPFSSVPEVKQAEKQPVTKAKPVAKETAPVKKATKKAPVKAAPKVEPKAAVKPVAKKAIPAKPTPAKKAAIEPKTVSKPTPNAKPAPKAAVAKPTQVTKPAQEAKPAPSLAKTITSSAKQPTAAVNNKATEVKKTK